MKLKLNALLIALLVFVADQASKWWVLNYFLIPERPPLEATPFFNLVLVWNRGISFGMLAENNQPVILTGISVFITTILLIWLWKNSSALVAIGLGLIIGGAVGNAIDRTRFGAVVDFLDFHAGSMHWPSFNIADSAIFIGVVLLCAHSMFTGHSKTP